EIGQSLHLTREHCRAKQRNAWQLLIEPADRISGHVRIAELPEDLLGSRVKNLGARELEPTLPGVLHQFVSHVEFRRVRADGQLCSYSETIDRRTGFDQSSDLIFVQSTRGENGDFFETGFVEHPGCESGWD